jgi:hypothetical protein
MPGGTLRRCPRPVSGSQRPGVSSMATRAVGARCKRSAAGLDGSRLGEARHCTSASNGAALLGREDD